MKKIINITLIIILSLVLVGCNRAESPKVGSISNQEINDNYVVTLETKEGSLTRSGLTLILENHSEYVYIYGQSYLIEYFNDGKWHALIPINDMNFLMIGILLQPNEIAEILVGWDYHYGKLHNGKYRVIKSVTRDGENSERIVLAAEFVIE